MLVMDRVSIHVCSKNRPTELYGLLTSLYLQYHKEWDLILVDESDTPLIQNPLIQAMLTRFKCEGHGVKYIFHQPFERQGVIHARNRAIKEDDLNQICFRIDDDSILDRFYLNSILEEYHKLKEKGIKVGGIAGIVPIFGSPEIKRDNQFVNGNFNKVKFHEDRIEVGDDAGFSYIEGEVFECDHLRSSFMFLKSAAIEAGLHSEELSNPVSFREETDFSMKLRAKGYKLYTVTYAKCWHLRSSGGGARDKLDQNQYMQWVQINEQFFNKKWLRLRSKGKIPQGTFEGV